MCQIKPGGKLLYTLQRDCVNCSFITLAVTVSQNIHFLGLQFFVLFFSLLCLGVIKTFTSRRVKTFTFPIAMKVF